MKFESIVEKYMKNISRGPEFAKVGKGKAGPMKSKAEKAKSPKKQRQDWKKQEKNY